MIFTRDFVTRENYWQIASLVTQKSLFTVTHALFFTSPISCLQLLMHWIYHSLMLTHWGLVMPYDIIELCQYWFRQWPLVAWWHQAITWISVDLLSAQSSHNRLGQLYQRYFIHQSLNLASKYIIHNFIEIYQRPVSKAINTLSLFAVPEPPTKDDVLVDTDYEAMMEDDHYLLPSTGHLVYLLQPGNYGNRKEDLLKYLFKRLFSLTTNKHQSTILLVLDTGNPTVNGSIKYQ